MKSPSFQFYPADWRNNANLRRCTPAARGVWMDVMCVLHDSDSYGLVRWPLVELASAAGATLKLVKKLVSKEVLKGCDSGECKPYTYTPRSGRRDGPTVTLVPTQAGPIWFSSRMVRDEYVRSIRGEGGKETRFGAENSAPDSSPMPPLSDGASSSSSSSPSVKKDDEEARATLTRVCQILRVELQADPARINWLRQIQEMMRDGLDPPRIIAATEIARTHGKLNLAYIRAIAFNPKKPQENSNGNGHGRESQHEQRARIIAEDIASGALERHAAADTRSDDRARVALPHLEDDRR